MNWQLKIRHSANIVLLPLFKIAKNVKLKTDFKNIFYAMK
tara:strand:+ start:1536 stop:1655 length:120 start_codon:yes stop_codon:yes gene_type:complete